MTAGRPSKLTRELIEKAKTYLSTCLEYYSDGTVKTVRLPSIEGFALFLSTARSVIYRWRDSEIDEDPALLEEFRDILEEILSTQANFLLNNGLSGNYNSTISALILGKHGYVKEQHQDITSKGDKVDAINYVTPNGNNSAPNPQAAPSV